MRKLAIIGCGGINSWSAKYLSELITDYEKKELLYIKLFDDDIIEEKNLLRSNQNFIVENLMQNKSDILGERYSFISQPVRIDESNINLLDNFDDIILGVDNNKTRIMIYKYCIEKKKYLLDLRAQGTQFMFIVVDNNKTFDYYKQKYFANDEINERRGSCQLDSDIQKDHLENGNKIIACFGILGIYFKHLRNETPSTNEYKFVY